MPSRAEFLDIVRNLITQTRLLGVEIRLGTEADADLGSRAEHPDVGGRGHGGPDHWRPVVVGRPSPGRRCARDVLEGRVTPSGDVVVIDELGFHQATATAELLADRGCRVEVAANGMVVGQDLGITLDMETWNVKAHAKGISQSVRPRPHGGGPTGRRPRPRPRRPGRRPGQGGVILTPPAPPDRHRDELRPCDWVVCAVHQQPEDRLWRELQGSPFPVHRIGDCLAPRRAHAAVVEGHRVAVAL